MVTCFPTRKFSTIHVRLQDHFPNPIFRQKGQCDRQNRYLNSNAPYNNRLPKNNRHFDISFQAYLSELLCFQALIL